jgi:hypothetical protein
MTGVFPTRERSHNIIITKAEVHADGEDLPRVMWSLG